MPQTSPPDRSLIEFFVEQTGFPEGVISEDASLGDFFGLRGDHLAYVLTVLEERTGARDVLAWIGGLPPHEQTLGRLAGHLADQHAAFPETAAAPLFQRLLLRTVDEPIPAGCPANPAHVGDTLLVGGAPAADALAERLRAANAGVQQLPWCDDSAALVAGIDAAWAVAPVTRLCFLPSPEEWPAPAGALWDARATLRMVSLFAACRHWLEHIERQAHTSQAALVAVTSLGGDFGFRNPFADPAGGGVAGLFKAIHAEWEGRVTVKVIDTAAGEPAKMVAAAVWRELAAGLPDVEVACVKGRREVVRAIPQPSDSRARRAITHGGAWVVTGGARGIMARTAAEIGHRYGASLHLIGSRTWDRSVGFNPRAATAEELRDTKARIIREARAQGRSPEIAWAEVERSAEIRETLEVLAKAGVTATYHTCDVTDRDALAATLRRIRASAPIHGILHGAGFESPGRLFKKTDEAVRKTIAARAEGTAALLDLTRDDPLEAFVLFGSLAGRFGSPLQADYSLSCDLASKVVAAAARVRPESRLVSIDWPNWDETGMSCRPEHRFLLDRRGVRRMAVREGLAHLIAEIEADVRDCEVAFVDPEGPHRSHPSQPDAAQAARMTDLNRRAGDSPLIDSIHLRANGSAIGAMTFDPTRDPFLTAHRDGGIPILPTVMAVEAAAETVCLAAEMPLVGEITDVKLMLGFRMPVTVFQRADLHAEPLPPREDGSIGYACRLAGNFYTEEGRLADPARVYQSMTVTPARQAPRLAAPPEAAAPATWTLVPYTSDWREPCPGSCRTLYNGPELSTLREVAYDTPAGSGNSAPLYSAERRPIANAWGRLTAPELRELAGRRTGTAWRTPPSLFDGVLVGCDMFAFHLFQGKQLPQAIERIRFGRMPRPGEKCVSRTICYGRDGRQFVFELWLMGEDGDVLIHAEGVRFVDRNVAIR